MRRTTFYEDARTDLAGPLDGLRVLDVTKVWSGPVATCVLADLGADVIRVEMPGNREGLMPPEIPGTGLPWFRQSVQRNKRSLTLDLRRAQAREVFLRLVATADVLVENYKPGTLDGWGIGYRECRQARPDIVFVSISGYGQYGSKSHRPGYDPIAQAAAGWMALNGEPDGSPLKSPTFLADDLAGLHATIATLAALRHRDRTGEGQHVDVAMLDALLYSSNGYLTLGATGVPLRRWGDQADFVVPAGTFKCLDGYVYITVALDKHWLILADLIDRPELGSADGYATNEQRRANRRAVNNAIGAWCSGRTTDDVCTAFETRGLAAERVRDFAEAALDPHVRERDMLQDTVLSNGTTAPLTGPAAKFSRTPTRVRTGAPEPGQHTNAILAELGYDESACTELRDARAI
jgi:formyl-CoA transferase